MGQHHSHSPYDQHDHHHGDHHEGHHNDLNDGHTHAHNTHRHDHHHDHDHNPKEDAHHHDEGIVHDHRPRQRERSMLVMTMTLTGVMMLIEFVGAWITNSISLLSDAIHMFTHFFAIAVSYFAIIMALRKAPQDKTYKYWRMEVLAALFNGFSLIPMVGYIVYISWNRLHDPEEVMGLQMFLVAFSGLLINIVCALILHKSSKEDINVRGAFLHMIADSLSSVGVIIAGGIIIATDWYPADPIAAVIVGTMILLWSVKLSRDSCRILLESVPSHIRIEEVESAILGIDGVKDIHDTHIWVITSRLYALTTHVILSNDMSVSEAMEIQHRIGHMLDDRFDITHACLQVESCTPECMVSSS